MTEYAPPFKVIFLLLLTCVCLVSVKAIEHECSPRCEGGRDSINGFLKGSAYIYSLVGTANIHLTESDNQETGAKIFAEATVYGLGYCANILKVTSLQIIGPDGKKYGKSEDFEKPIRFRMEDGLIHPQICAEENDSERSLNIKRSIISLFQTAVTRDSQIDVFGKCSTTYSENGTTIITKTKDLNSCENHYYNSVHVFNYILNNGPNRQIIHPMQANLKVDTILKSGVVEEAEAVETYFYKPFSDGKSGVGSVVNTKIMLKETKQEIFNDNINCVIVKSITFENVPEVKMEKANFENLKTALKTATQYLERQVQTKSASFFTALIRVLRVSSKDDIYKIFSEISNDSIYTDKQLTKSVLLDALFRTGTSDSIDLLMKLLKDNELDSLQKRLFFISLSNARSVSLDTLLTMTELLDLPNLPNEAYMGAGSLAAAYCRDHHCQLNVESRNNTDQLHHKLFTKLDACVAQTKEKEDEIIVIIKALKNFNHIKKTSIRTLRNCMNNKSIKTRIRIAALEIAAIETDHLEFRWVAIKVLRDKTEDSELRIQAYLALLKSPDRYLRKSVATILNDESPSLQVASFITSSLKNLKKSTDPAFNIARLLFHDFPLPNKFPTDPRKYSQEYIMKYDLKNYGMSSEVQSNIIYSAKSFVPRSANLDLSVNIFGKSVNLFELGVRQGNLNGFLEESFGPHGSFYNLRSQDEVYNNFKSMVQQIYEKLQKRLKLAGSKTKRDIQSQVTEFKKTIMTNIEGYKNNLDLDVFMKIFGSESVFLSLGDDKPFSVESLIDRVFDLVEDGIYGKPKFSHELRSHMLFLDVESAFPTSSGLVMKFNVEGATTGKLVFGGDIGQIFNDQPTTEVELNLIPSANVVITGSISIEADYFSTGVKVFSSLHTSTGYQLKAKLSDNDGGLQGFDIKLDLPFDKQELISITNDVAFFTRQKGSLDVSKETKITTDSKGNLPKCNDGMKRLFGFTFCVDSMKKNPDYNDNVYSPLNWPAKFRAYLDLEEPKRYHLYGSSKIGQDKSFWELGFVSKGVVKENTIKGRVDVIAERGNESLQILLSAPMKVIKASAARIIVNDDFIFKFDFQNDKDVWLGKFGWTVNRLDAKETYRPILEYSAPGFSKDLIKIEGQIFNENFKFTLNEVCLVVKDERIYLGGWINTSEKPSPSFTLKLSHKENTAALSRKGLDDLARPDDEEIEFHNTLNSQFNFRYRFYTDFKMNYLKSRVFIHGPDFNSKQNVITWNTSVNDSQPSIPIPLVHHHFTYPLFNMDIKTASRITYGGLGLVNIEFEGKYKEYKAGLLVDFDYLIMKSNELSGRIKAVFNDKGGDIKMKYTQVTILDSKMITSIVLYSGGEYEMEANLKKSKASDGINLTGFLKKPEKDLLILNSGYSMTPNSYDSHIKINCGSVVLFNCIAKTDFDKMSGKVVLVIKDKIVVNGDAALNSDTKKAALDLTVDLVPLGNVIYLNADMVVDNPKYSGEMKIYTDYTNDKNKLYRLVSKTEMKDSSDIDSKNVLFYNNQQIKFDIKIHDEEDKINLVDDKYYHIDFYDAEGEIYNAVFESKANHVDDVYNKKTSVSVSKKTGTNGKPKKLTFDVDLSDFNEFESMGSLAFQTTFVNDHGKDVIFKALTKVNKHDESNVGEIKASLSGSMIPNDVSFSTHMDYSNTEDNNMDFIVKYNLLASYGTKFNFDGIGTYIYHPLKNENFTQSMNNFDIKISLPGKKLHTIRLTNEEHFSLRKDSSKYDDSFIAKSVTLMLLNEDRYFCDVDVQSVKHDILFKVGLEIPERDPYKLCCNYTTAYDDTGHTLSEHNGQLEVHGEKLSLNWNRCQGIFSSDDDSVITLTLPASMGSKNFINKIKIESNSTFNIRLDSTLEDGGKIYSLNAYIDIQPSTTSVFEIKSTYLNDIPDRLFITTVKRSDNDGYAKLMIESGRDIFVDIETDWKLASGDRFTIKVDVDCPKLHKAKLIFETKNSASKPHEMLFVVTESGDNLITAMISYQVKNDGVQYIFEGISNIRIKDVENRGRFKFIQGDDMAIFNSAIGSKSVTLEYTFVDETPYKFIAEYCDEIDCAVIKFDTDMKQLDGYIAAGSSISFDLRKIGIETEFGINIWLYILNYKVRFHDIDFHISRRETKYAVTSSSKYFNQKYVTDLTITIPTRVIDLRTKTSLADDKEWPAFPLVQETIFYSNLNDPNSKFHFKTNLDYYTSYGKEVVINGSILLLLPGSPKESKVDVSYKYDKSSNKDIIHHSALLVFNGQDVELIANETFTISKNSAKISAVFKTVVLKKTREFSFLTFIEPNLQKLKITSPAGDLAVINSEIEECDGKNAMGAKWKCHVGFFNDALYHLDGNLDLSNGVVADLSTVVLSTDDHLKLQLTLLPFTDVGFTAEYKLSGHNYPLVNVGYGSKNSTVSALYNTYEDANVKTFVKATKLHLNGFVASSTVFMNNSIDSESMSIKQLADNVRREFPDLTNTINFYANEIKAIGEELKNDKNLPLLSIDIEINLRVLYSVIENVFVLVSEMSKMISFIMEAACIHLFTEVLPTISELCVNLTREAVEICTTLLRLSFDIVLKINNFIEFFIPYWKHMVIDFYQYVTQSYNAVCDWMNELSIISSNVVTALVNDISNHPLVSYITTKINENCPPDVVMDAVKKIAIYFSDIYTTDEWKNFYNSIMQYIEKKVYKKSETSDYGDVLDILKKAKLVAVSNQSPIKLNLNKSDALKLMMVSLSSNIITGSPGYQFIIDLEKDTLRTDAKMLLVSYLNPKYISPKNVHSYIVGGRRLFTFDGSLITLTKNCQYLLAQDTVDGNFTIFLNLMDGKTHSLTLVDQYNNSIEIRKGKYYLNGDPTDLPIIKHTINAHYNTDEIAMSTDNGASVKCSMNLDICDIEVSGYYHAKLRGLLGDANNEPFDDKKNLDGHVEDDDITFAKAYTLSSDNCENISLKKNYIKKSSMFCSNIFDRIPELIICNLAVDKTIYKAACRSAYESAHSAMTARLDACLIVKTYVTNCKAHSMLVTIPFYLPQCSHLEKENKKKPQFDIVIAMETTQDELTFTELVFPLISQLVKKFKENNIRDININLVGITPLNSTFHFDGNDQEMKRINFRVAGSSLRELYLQEDGINNLPFNSELNKFEWTPAAARFIIVVHSGSCPLQPTTNLEEKFKNGQKGKIYLITPTVLGDGSNSGSIIGFNEDSAFLMGNKTKEISDGDVKYTTDKCIQAALQTGGIVYSSRNFHLQQDTKNRNDFLATAAETLHDSMTKVNQ